MYVCMEGMYGECDGLTIGYFRVSVWDFLRGNCRATAGNTKFGGGSARNCLRAIGWNFTHMALALYVLRG